MTTLIRSAILEHYTKPRPEYKGSGKISCSSFGRCMRSVMMDLAGVETPNYAGFPSHIREVMDYGTAYEDVSFKLLKEKYGSAITTQQRVGDAIWSGKLDFLIKLPGEQPIIGEHKSTGNKYFDYNLEFPKWEHVCQAWLYGQLYEAQFHVKPRVIIYYIAWTSWAEFELFDNSDSGHGYALGEVDGATVRRPVALEILPARRAAFEAAYKALPAIPEIPCNSPCDAYGCLFRGEKSCRFFDICWPQNEG